MGVEPGMHVGRDLLGAAVRLVHEIMREVVVQAQRAITAAGARHESRLPLGVVSVSAVPCRASNGTVRRSGRAQTRCAPSSMLRAVRAGRCLA